jgi:hypothetical protein
MSTSCVTSSLRSSMLHVQGSLMQEAVYQYSKGFLMISKPQGTIEAFHACSLLCQHAVKDEHAYSG